MGLESAGRRIALIGRRVLPTFGVWTCIAVILKTFFEFWGPWQWGGVHRMFNISISFFFRGVSGIVVVWACAFRFAWWLVGDVWRLVDFWALFGLRSRTLTN